MLEFTYTKNRKSYWKCQCECGNICYITTTQLTTGETVSCGCKNNENRANLPNLDRGLWVAKIMFQHKPYLLGRFKYKRETIKARRAGEDKFLENIDKIHVFSGMRFSSKHMKIRLEPSYN